mgnify:CR=1 FL=1
MAKKQTFGDKKGKKQNSKNRIKLIRTQLSDKTGSLRFTEDMLVVPEGENADSLGLDGTETFDIPASADLVPLSNITVTATHPEGRVTTFEATVRLDTPVEVEYYRHGGILQTVLRNLAQS